MNYYKAKRFYDKYNYNDRKLLNDCKLETLVEDELFTAGEVKKFKIPLEALQEVEVKRSDTHHCFGARFKNI